MYYSDGRSVLQGARKWGFILGIFHITAEQIIYSLLAIPAFFPAFVCTGYMAAWFTNLHSFRQRSLVERFFWSVPLSIATSTIASVLIGKFVSLAAVVAFFLASAALWLVVLGREWLSLRRSGRTWIVGWRPLGGTGMAMAMIWIAVAILSLVDLQSNQQLFMSVTAWDHSARVNWTESILRTGIPPANPLYYYGHSAPMRYYYFWNVICAAVGKMTHLPTRAVFIASCVWSGFALAALIGLYLKHFLVPGELLRRRFLLSISLLMVTGLDICVHFWNVFFLHGSLPGDLEWWSAGQITSWLDSLLWVPHHIASMVCCMCALLLAWMAGKDRAHSHTASIALIAAALASAFGLSIYIAFAFFLVMLAWALWQIAIERTPRSPLLLAAGGAGAVVLLLPYLLELTHNQSKMAGGSVFTFAIREMFPPAGLLGTHFFQYLATGHPLAAENLANLILLLPGYIFELGFYLAVFLVYLVPAWHRRKPLNPAERSLVFIVTVTLLLISVIRSSVLKQNDFGWRGALLLQFPLLLMASDTLTTWGFLNHDGNKSVDCDGLPHCTPYWFRSIASIALLIGVFSTLCQVLLLRFDSSLMSAANNQDAIELSHKAYFSSIGYAQLNAFIPRDAVVQYNPGSKIAWWMEPDLFGIDHQTAIAGDQPWCGSELKGDPGGCLVMASAIDSLFKGATAEQARATCSQYGIGYLVASVYDAVWNDRNGWVWTLKPVVSNEGFRALDCHH